MEWKALVGEKKQQHKGAMANIRAKVKIWIGKYWWELKIWNGKRSDKNKNIEWKTFVIYILGSTNGEKIYNDMIFLIVFWGRGNPISCKHV